MSSVFRKYFMFNNRKDSMVGWYSGCFTAVDSSSTWNNYVCDS